MAPKSFNCPNCGAPYNPTQLKCEYCDSFIIISNEQQYNVPREIFEPIIAKRQEIQQEDKAIPEKPEVKIPGIYVYGTLLGENEIPIRLGSANYYVNALVNKGGKVLLTEKKLYFSSHNFVQSKTDLTIDLKDIEKAVFDSNMLISQQISVYAKGKRHKFVVYGGREWVEKIMEAKEALLKKPEPKKAKPAAVVKEAPKPAPKTTTAQPSANYIEELKQLKELLDAGIITEEEFAIKKRMILGL